MLYFKERLIQMDYETRKAYTEMCAVLEYMPEEYIKKIPRKIIDLFESKKIENYKVNINKKNPVDKNYLSKKTLTIIAMLNYMCWCPNQKAKDELYEQYVSNYVSNNEKYNPDNLFKHQKAEKVEIKEETLALVEYREKTFIQKVFDKIKIIFKIK